MDLVSIGNTIKEFNETFGDYMKVEVRGEHSNNILGTFYSNRLLLKYAENDGYYLGSYHYHIGNMGFCTEKHHTDSSISKLKPIPMVDDIDDPLNSNTVYKKQLNVFKDDAGRLHIKPNEIIKLLEGSNSSGKYKLRIYFLRSIKSTLGIFLKINKNNLVENGNFFAGLEATQTGDLDKSNGKNKFIRIGNPGFSPFALEQNGLPGSKYSMKVTGIQPNSSYIFSCWIAWDENFNGDPTLVSFSDVNSTDPTKGLPQPRNTNLDGSYDTHEWSYGGGRIIKKIEISGLVWYRLYSFVLTDDLADLGSILIHLGNSIGNYKASKNPLGRRFFTDVRFEKINNINNASIVEWRKKLHYEPQIGSLFNYFNPKLTSTGKEEVIIDDNQQEMADIINTEAQSGVQSLEDSLTSINVGGIVPNPEWPDGVENVQDLIEGMGNPGVSSTMGKRSPTKRHPVTKTNKDKANYQRRSVTPGKK